LFDLIRGQSLKNIKTSKAWTTHFGKKSIAFAGNRFFYRWLRFGWGGGVG